MKKEFTPIAMKCNKEQFEAIKPKLEGLEIKHIDDFKSYIYLTNNGGNIITNVANAGLSYGNHEFCEEWNEKVFLEACGIETEQEYTITKSQLLELKNGYKTEKLREWFPEAFETVLKVGKWIFVDRGDQSEQKALVFYQGGETPTYGFTHDGYWSNRYGNGYDTFSNSKYKYSYPTESEVFEALKNEAVKRGFVGNQYIDISELGFKNNELITGGQIEWKDGWLNFGDKQTAIFRNGIWGNVLPTITRKEAENKLGVKIVD